MINWEGAKKIRVIWTHDFLFKGISSESSTYVLKSANGKAVTEDCRPAKLVLGAATKHKKP